MRHANRSVSKGADGSARTDGREGLADRMLTTAIAEGNLTRDTVLQA